MLFTSQLMYFHSKTAVLFMLYTIIFAVYCSTNLQSRHAEDSAPLLEQHFGLLTNFDILYCAPMNACAP